MGHQRRKRIPHIQRRRHGEPRLEDFELREELGILHRQKETTGAQHETGSLALKIEDAESMRCGPGTENSAALNAI